MDRVSSPFPLHDNELVQAQLANAPPFQLLETMLYTPDKGIVFLERHLDRLCATAACLGADRFNAPNKDRLKALLLKEVDGLTVPTMVRLLYSSDSAHVEVSPMAEDTLKTSRNGKTRKVVIGKQPVNSHDIFLRHKTTNRDVYTSARTSAGVSQNGIFDVLLVNEDAHVTETSIANVAVEAEDGTLYTPPVSCGLLPGVMREELLDSGMIVEKDVSLHELLEAVKLGRRVLCFNSVRGIYDVEILVEEPKRRQSSSSVSGPSP